MIVKQKISACCFIRDNNVGAFCLWESMAQIIPFVDEYIIMDCGSTDGTLEILNDLAAQNPKIRIVHGSFMRDYGGKLDCRIFADLANELVAMCKHDVVFYHQADEIFHEDLLELLRAELEKGIPEDWRGLNFWRYQLKENFQTMKWWPHQVNRIGLKSRFHFTGDGMNTDTPGPVLYGFEAREWQTFFHEAPELVPTRHMILDVSMVGGFLETILKRRQLHAPIWGESPDVLYGVASGGAGVNIHGWMAVQRKKQEWRREETKFDIPAIMRWHLGKQEYIVRQEILEKISKG
jgi:hypothetical protein